VVGVQGLLCAAYAATLAGGSAETLRAANLALPLGTLLACGWAAARLVAREPWAVWTPMPWFLLANGVSYGLGPLSNHLGSEESVRSTWAFVTYDERAILRTNLLNSCGIFLVVAAQALAARLAGPLRRAAGHTFLPARGEVFWLKLFLGIGVPARYLLFLPYTFGLLPFVLPGVVVVMAGFTHVAVFLAAKQCLQGRPRWLPLTVFLAAGNVMTALATFSKLEALISMLGLVLAVYVVRRRVRYLLGAGAGMVLLYFALVPFVPFGRRSVGASGGLGERLEVLREYAARPEVAERPWDQGVQGWWTRLNNSPLQVFAMAEHDAGRSGDTFALALTALIPRVLQPDKPVLRLGNDFNLVATGSGTSASSPTFFGEAYWNGGWGFLALAALWAGVVFAAFERTAARYLAVGNVGILPVALLSVQIAMAPEAWFATSYVATPGLAIVYYVGLAILGRLLPGSGGAPRRVWRSATGPPGRGAALSGR
jgi:hypothetical protein